MRWTLFRLTHQHILDHCTSTALWTLCSMLPSPAHCLTMDCFSPLCRVAVLNCSASLLFSCPRTSSCPHLAVHHLALILPYIICPHLAFHTFSSFFDRIMCRCFEASYATPCWHASLSFPLILSSRLLFPTFAGSCLLIFAVGRILYGRGYVSGGPEGRYYISCCHRLYGLSTLL